MSVALRHPLAYLVLEIRKVACRGVTVERNCCAHLAAEQLVQGHAATLAQDVPERAVDPAERVVACDSAAKVRLHICRLPDVFDLVAVPAHDEGLQIILDVRSDWERPLPMRCTPDAVQTRLVRQH